MMSSSSPNFEPLKVVHAVPVHWELSRDDYEKLRDGNDKARNHWHWLMENNQVHIYKGTGGMEHFRFTVHPPTDEMYLVESIETRGNAFDDEQAMQSYDNTAIEDVTEMLSYFFDIEVSDKNNE